MEFEPENDLFLTAQGGGLGEAHRGRATCGVCGRTVNPEAETEEDPDWLGDQWYRQLVIGDLVILDCCFPKIENLALHLARRTNMLSWLAEQLAGDRARLAKIDRDLEVRRALAEAAAVLLGKR